MTDSTSETSFSEPEPTALAELPEPVRNALWNKGSLTEYAAGHFIVRPGDSGDTIRLLITGRASVVFLERDGQEIPVETITSGDLIGEVSYFTGRPAPENFAVRAAEACGVLEIPGEKFGELLRESPDCAISVLKNLARKVIRLDWSVYKKLKKKRALQNLISRQEHLFPDYFVSETVRRRVKTTLDQLAQSDVHVLVGGETGVGKEFLAHALYGMSPFHKRVFLYLDLVGPVGETVAVGDYCELPEPAADATERQMHLFFGSETRSEDGKSIIETPGYLELTEEGTLLVKGVEQLTPVMQTRLLDALKTGVFRRVGGSSLQNIDFRLIGTTNLDASEISAEKHPLLSWLLTNSLVIPPLRKRKKEIPLLAEHYVNHYCQELHKDARRLPKETVKVLVSYSWPGNDRELATTLKRAVLLSDDGYIRPNHVYFDLRSVEPEGKINLMQVPALRRALKSPLFPAIFQSAAAPFFFILVVLLFLGPADPMQNPGGLFSWAIGWPTMVFGSFLWARFWCSICPMGTLSHLAKKILALEIPFPPSLKHHSDLIIAGSALFIIWLETATNMRSSPFNTGLLLLTILLLAAVVSVIFERQSWCRYLCPLGGMMGVFAKVSPFELRADRNLCSTQCTSNECFTGTAEREGCPFGQVAPSIRSNRFCKMCANCIKNCPYAAINLNVRVPGSELWEMKQTGAITAVLVVSMLGGLLSDLLRHSRTYDAWFAYAGMLPEIVRFSLFFLLVVVGANGLVIVASVISSRSSGETARENLARYGLALLPLVLSGYMAFHLYYFIHLGVYFPILLWQTFHFELFQQLVITIPPAWTLFLQRLLIVIGVLGTLVVSWKLSRGSQISLAESLREYVPHGIVALGFAVLLFRVLADFFA
ncbi:MAG: sigma 54-interacting transcriptional regulator [Desulfomonile tiedjei]|nr:sigma 54-interacting transcriptional regulator [Desulfomonile tiedjei]